MSEEEKFIADFIRILLIAIVTALLSTATFLVWARAIGVGRGNVLESGTIGRFAMILWRQVSLIGYMLPIFIAVAIVNYMFLLFLIRILGIQGGGLAVASVLVYLLTLALILLVLVGFAISVAATAVDDRRGIMASLQAIKGRTAAPLMAGGAILVGLVIVTLLVSAIMTGLFGGQVLSTLALIVLITLYSMFMLTLVALGRAVYEQIVNSTASGPAQT